MTLLKLRRLKDCINMAYLARESGWDRASLSKHMSDKKDMLKTQVRRERMEALLETLRGIRDKLDQVIKYYEDRMIMEKELRG